jgi:hypothetical protein
MAAENARRAGCQSVLRNCQKHKTTTDNKTTDPESQLLFNRIERKDHKDGGSRLSVFALGSVHLALGLPLKAQSRKPKNVNPQPVAHHAPRL